jgi:plasmid stabilization system protein ParE
MSLAIQRSIFFFEDFMLQAEWYAARAGEEVANRWQEAVDATLHALAASPGLGRRRRLRHRELKNIRSFRVNPPFDIHLVFYRFDDKALYAERLIHGGRDLPRRISQPPGAS